MPTDEKGFHYVERTPGQIKEKQELLALTDMEALALPHPMQYQRMRYLREDEGAIFVKKVQEEARIAREREEIAKIGNPTGVRSTISRKEYKRSGYDKD